MRDESIGGLLVHAWNEIIDSRIAVLGLRVSGEDPLCEFLSEIVLGPLLRKGVDEENARINRVTCAVQAIVRVKIFWIWEVCTLELFVERVSFFFLITICMKRHDGAPLSPGPSVEVEVSIRIAPSKVFGG